MVVLPTSMGSGMGRFLSGRVLGLGAKANGSLGAIVRLGDVCNPPPASGARLSALSIAEREAYAGRTHAGDGGDSMGPRIIVVPPSAETGEIAREMAPAGFELVLARGGAELEAALGSAEYMVCYPNVKMPDAFYRAAPRMRLVQLLSAGYDAVHLQAAPRAQVPVSNNRGPHAQSPAQPSLLPMPPPS